MTSAPTDLEIAALISSKICHDAINPVAAINHGLQMLEDESDAGQQKFTLDMIRNVTAQASARIEFARVAFGSSGSSTAPIDLGKAGEVAVRYVSPQQPMAKNKHRLTWSIPPMIMDKDKGKLVLNLVSVAVSALVRGGEIAVSMTGTTEAPAFLIVCKGVNARVPQVLVDLLVGADLPLDAMNIQAYYVARLAKVAAMTVTAEKVDADVIFTAKAA